jgi:hypothetical protein
LILFVSILNFIISTFTLCFRFHFHFHFHFHFCFCLFSFSFSFLFLLCCYFPGFTLGIVCGLECSKNRILFSLTVHIKDLQVVILRQMHFPFDTSLNKDTNHWSLNLLPRTLVSMVRESVHYKFLQSLLLRKKPLSHNSKLSFDQCTRILLSMEQESLKWY